MPRRVPTAVTAVAAALVCVGTLGACGSSAGSDAAASATGTSTAKTTASAPGTSSANAQKIAVSLTGSKVTPLPGKVKVAKNTTVNLTVTRDTTGEVHVHGYDIEKVAKANVPTTFTFVADQQGVFEVEAHSPDVLLLQLQVQ